MKLQNPTFVVLIFLFSLSVLAQQPSPTPDDDVVKITSKLVQFDAVVIDKDGNQVPDLRESDFEILQDGRPQKITNFSYVGTGAAAPVVSVKGAVAVPTRVRSADVGRIITFIVDDGNCMVSLGGMNASREALEKFVNEQMLPNDFVAIYQTRSGSSMMQQYTSDKAYLLKAVRKIRWFPPGGGCAFSDGGIWDAARQNAASIPTVNGVKTVSAESEAEKKSREHFEDSGRNNQAVGTLGVLRYAIRGLEHASGRKIMFFLSDGLPLYSRDGELLSAVDVLRDLTERANRSSVVFNTIDVRGQVNTEMIDARDDVSTLGDANATAKLTDVRRRDMRDSQTGLAFLADETGGQFFKGQNYLDGPIKQTLNKQKGYYLIAYAPDDDTFKGKKFNKIEIRLKRPDLKISSRSGFVAAVTEEAKPRKATENGDLYEAIVAPLPRAGMNLGLTAFFGNAAADGNFVRSLVHLEGSEITFVDEAGGLKKAVLDVVAVTLSEKNDVVDEFTRSHTVKVPAAAMPLIMRYGLIYSTDVPVKKPGIYNFRVAVRDSASRLLGSASQIVEIPDLKKGRLFLSGLTVAETDAKGKFTIPVRAEPDQAISIAPSAAVPGVRQMIPGTILGYSYTIYNAKPDPAANQPKLTIQTNLFYNGKMILEGPPKPAELTQQTDWSHIDDYGYIRLNAKAQPGDYALQVIVRDLSVSGKYATVSQWIDFEVK